MLLLEVLSFSNFHGCALAPDGLTGYVVTLDSIMVLKTTDGGAIWHQISTTASRRFFDVCCTDGEKVWTCGVLGEIMHSRDGGGTWELQVTGVSKYLTRIEFLDSLYGWAVGGDGVIARTRNGGEYWDQYFTPYYLAEYYGVTFADTLTVYAVAGWPDSCDTGQGYIVKSVDGGENCSSLYQSTGYEDYLDVHAINENVIVVVGGNDQTLEPIILRSTNGGSTWDSITAIPENTKYLRALEFIGNKGWAVGRTGTILYTEDGGLTWTRQNSPQDSTLFDVDFSDELHGIACGYNHVIYTLDGGETWNDGVIAGIAEEPNEGPVTLTIKTIFGGNEYTFFLKSRNEYTVRVSLSLTDITGRKVKRWEDITFQNEISISWDGKSDSGSPLPSGIYYLLVESEGKLIPAELLIVN